MTNRVRWLLLGWVLLLGACGVPEPPAAVAPPAPPAASPSNAGPAAPVTPTPSGAATARPPVRPRLLGCPRAGRSPGGHTIWMREDGFRVDRILLTTSSTFVPSGAGPAESPRVGSSAISVQLCYTDRPERRFAMVHNYWAGDGCIAHTDALPL